MKPTPVAVKYFLDEIIKRVSKAFAKSELNKEEFDDVINNVENVRDIVSKVEKEGTKDDRHESDKES